MAGAVLIVAAIAAVVSYIHIERLAVTPGQTWLAALLMPVSLDGTITAASLALLDAARAGLPSPWLGRLMLGLGVAATVAANAVEGASCGPVGVMVSAWPTVAFIGGIELLAWAARTARLSAPEVAPQAAPAIAPETVRPDAALAVGRVQPVSRSRAARPSASRAARKIALAAAEKAICSSDRRGRVAVNAGHPARLEGRSADCSDAQGASGSDRSRLVSCPKDESRPEVGSRCVSGADAGQCRANPAAAMSTWTPATAPLSKARNPRQTCQPKGPPVPQRV